MIIVRIMGGLGNQMFQYAAGRRLAAIHNTVLKLDISDFRDYNLHDYGLSVFSIKELFATPEEIKLLKEPESSSFKKKLKKILRRPNKLGITHIQEKQYHFAPEILTMPDSVYLDGYWQSEKYFLDTPLVNQRQLLKAGIKKENIYDCGTCTSCSRDFFSYRRQGEQAGRMLSVMMLR